MSPSLLVDTVNDRVLPQPLSDHRTAPQHLRAAAYLYGLETAELEGARVLELGCAGGVNLLPFARAYPHAQVVGIDIDKNAVAWGQQQLVEQNITNLQIFAIDLDTLLGLGEELGTYHYIIVHGVFSMLDAESRVRIQSFCQAHLTEDGIACFDYPTYPGARSKETLRDALLFHSSLANTEDEKIQAARAMLGFMAQGLPDKSPVKSTLLPLVEQAERQPDLMLSLKYLQGLQQPCHFIEFADSLSQCGLTYVGDAETYAEVPLAWGEQVEQWHSLINPEGKKVLGQQYLDFLCNRSSRLSIVTHQRHAEKILPVPALDRLKDLRWAGSFTRTRSAEEQAEHRHLTGDGGLVSSQDEMVQAIMDHLGYVWPASLDYSALLFNTRPVVSLEENAESTHADKLAQALRSMFLLLGDKLQLMREPSPYDSGTQRHLSLVPGGWISEKPAASPDAKKRFCAINYWQREIELQLTSTEVGVLNSLDGSSGPREWQAAFRRGMASSVESHQEEAMEVLKLLSRLADRGLLQGSPDAWLEFLLFAQRTEQSPVRAAWYTGRVMAQAFPVMRGKTAGSIRVQHPARNDPAHDLALQQIRETIGKGEIDRAERLGQKLIEKFPDSYQAWHELARVMIAANRYSDCVPLGLKALELQPDEVGCYTGVAVGLKYSKQGWLFQHIVEMILRVDPDCGAAWDMLGIRYVDMNLIELGMRCTQRGLELEPANVDRLSNLARNYSMQMRLSESLACYEKALSFEPENFFLHNNYLFTSLHSVELDPQELFARHRRFGKVAEKRARNSGLKLVHVNKKDPNKRLRVGFVSGDLRKHAVAYFIEPYFSHIDKNQVSLHIYNNYFFEDTVSERLRTHVTSWLDVAGMSDERLAKRINEDRIDILIDLSGHTAYNRLPVFAYKPAPVQITWIGYPGTTGLQAMDYKIIADCNNFGDLDKQFTEKFILMPNRILFQESKLSPEVNPLPFGDKGYITFGSFNRPQKLSDQVLAAWVEILHKLPCSRLLIANMPDEPTVKKIRVKLKKMGCDLDRVDFRFREKMEEYLRLHHEVDILLDTFPYNGGTTTSHALWMGVPTLTLAGETIACRHGVPILTQYELSDFISYSIDEYIQKAISLSERKEMLSEIRRSLRERIASRHVDVDEHVKTFSLALREVWGRWCLGEAVSHLDCSDLLYGY